jgi:hypothetical protein
MSVDVSFGCVLADAASVRRSASPPSRAQTGLICWLSVKWTRWRLRVGWLPCSSASSPGMVLDAVWVTIQVSFLGHGRRGDPVVGPVRSQDENCPHYPECCDAEAASAPGQNEPSKHVRCHAAFAESGHGDRRLRDDG